MARIKVAVGRDDEDEGRGIYPAIAAAMAARGISGLEAPGFAAARAEILDEALGPLGYQWQADPGDSEDVRVWPVGARVDWPALLD